MNARVRPSFRLVKRTADLPRRFCGLSRLIGLDRVSRAQRSCLGRRFEFRGSRERRTSGLGAVAACALRTGQALVDRSDQSPLVSDRLTAVLCYRGNVVPLEESRIAGAEGDRNEAHANGRVGTRFDHRESIHRHKDSLVLGSGEHTPQGR